MTSVSREDDFARPLAKLRPFRHRVSRMLIVVVQAMIEICELWVLVYLYCPTQKVDRVWILSVDLT